MKRRLLSIIISLLMAVTLLPTAAMAADDEQTNAVTVTEVEFTVTGDGYYVPGIMRGKVNGSETETEIQTGFSELTGLKYTENGTTLWITYIVSERDYTFTCDETTKVIINVPAGMELDLTGVSALGFDVAKTEVLKEVFPLTASNFEINVSAGAGKVYLLNGAKLIGSDFYASVTDGITKISLNVPEGEAPGYVFTGGTIQVNAGKTLRFGNYDVLNGVVLTGTDDQSQVIFTAKETVADAFSEDADHYGLYKWDSAAANYNLVPLEVESEAYNDTAVLVKIINTISSDEDLDTNGYYVFNDDENNPYTVGDVFKNDQGEIKMSLGTRQFQYHTSESYLGKYIHVVITNNENTILQSAVSQITGMQYKIKYKTNSGYWEEGYTAPESYTFGGDAVTLPTSDNITRTDRVFHGWFDNAEFTGEAVTEISTGDAGDKTYYAKWVTHAEAPQITKQPGNPIIYSGSSAILSVNATFAEGHKGSYQWYRLSSASAKGGTKIEGATRRTYLTESLTAGTYYYYCVVTATRLEDSDTASAASNVAMVFVSNPYFNISGATVTGIKSRTYTGKALYQSPKVVLDGKTLKKGVDYELTYSKNKNAGTATVTITGIGDYEGSISKTFTIKKAVNTLKLKIAAKRYKLSSVKKAKKTFNIGVKNARGTVSCTPDSKAKKAGIKVTSKGKVTIPKNCKKGTYKITVKASGNGNYKAGSETVTIKIT